jgi:hypothetical protein
MRRTQRRDWWPVSHIVPGLATRYMTYFLMMMYLRAFPRVWPSLRNSNEAAVGVEPGSCSTC